MDGRKGKPFNRPVETRSREASEIGYAHNQFLNRMQTLDAGKTYKIKELEATFNLRYTEGLRGLLREFAKWRKVGPDEYQLLEKTVLAVPDSLPEHMESVDDQYSLLVRFFSEQDEGKEFYAKDILRGIGGVKSPEALGVLVNLLLQLEPRGQIKVNRSNHYQKGGNYLYSWVGEKLNE